NWVGRRRSSWRLAWSKMDLLCWAHHSTRSIWPKIAVALTRFVDRFRLPFLNLDWQLVLKTHVKSSARSDIRFCAAPVMFSAVVGWKSLKTTLSLIVILSGIMTLFLKNLRVWLMNFS